MTYGGSWTSLQPFGNDANNIFAGTGLNVSRTENNGFDYNIYETDKDLSTGFVRYDKQNRELTLSPEAQENGYQLSHLDFWRTGIEYMDLNDK